MLDDDKFDIFFGDQKKIFALTSTKFQTKKCVSCEHRGKTILNKCYATLIPLRLLLLYRTVWVEPIPILTYALLQYRQYGACKQSDNRVPVTSS